MKKFFKISLSIIFIISILLVMLFLTFATIIKDAKLEPNKLTGSGQNITICDSDGNEITTTSSSTPYGNVLLNDLPQHIVNAVISTEDRTFFKHNGLNYKRMLKALIKNITSASFKEGASTITQQLIKNTHLSNDKTIKRKLKEIKLAKQLERRYSKEQILEMYLNTIYFGHNCYGLQSAAQFYFDKKAEQLTLNESATIVGLLASPNNYSPFKNPEKSVIRRNFVLKNMFECGYLSEPIYREAINRPLDITENTNKSKYASYIDAVFEELEELGLDNLMYENYTIKTYMNRDLQNYIENIDSEYDNATIITSNLTGGIQAFKSTIANKKRQPGSTVKPILVYGPAIEEKIIYPDTKILDESVNFRGYKPENSDKIFHGYVTVAESIQKSYNIPAVKVLNSLSIKNAEKYANAMKIKLDDDEKNLALALGGMKNGLSLKQLADSYSVFPLSGYFKTSKFIGEITLKDGYIVYRNETTKNKIFSKSTCSLMNEMLIETSKTGTAKKLKDIPYDVASKTGTCGTIEGNTDAYTVSYTSENCIAVWRGDKNNNKIPVTGGNDCCIAVKNILHNLYSTHYPAQLDTQTDTIKIKIDREEYETNNLIVIADPLCPLLNLKEIRVPKENVPSAISDRFYRPTISTPTITVKDNIVNIQLCHTKYYQYLIKRKNGRRETIIYDGIYTDNITDMPDCGTYTYSVTPYYLNNSTRYTGKEIVLPSVFINKHQSPPNEQIPEIVNKKWYN